MTGTAGDSGRGGQWAPRRVLVAADAVGGVWDYTLELCRGLGQWGTEVTLAVMGPSPDPVQIQAACALSNVELCVRSYKLEWMEAPWDDVDLAGAWLLDLANQRRVDLVHLNMYAFGALPFPAPTLVVGHSCVLTWWHAVKGENAPPAWQTYRARVAAGLRGATAVAAPTAWMLSELRALYGPFGRTAVIGNGRRAEIYRPQPKRPVVLFAGRLWDEAKNAALLVRAAPRVPWPVKIAGAIRPIVGGGGACPDLATADPAPVELLGRLPPQALARWYAEASIYTLPARYEPFGLSALEAALSGCALVLGDIPSLREVWGEAALFVDPDDEEALVSALTMLMEHPALLAQWAARARAHAQRYSADQMVLGYLALYESLLASCRPNSVLEEVTPPCVL
jgi:glycogen synthase